MNKTLKFYNARIAHLEAEAERNKGNQVEYRLALQAAEHWIRKKSWFEQKKGD